MAIRCGHCKETHDTVAEVRACSQEHSGLTAGQSKYEHLSAGQANYLRSLLSQFRLGLVGGVTPETASYEFGRRVLEGLIDARRNRATGKDFVLPEGVFHLTHVNEPDERTMTHPPMPDVPQGYYAVPDWTGREELKFVFVKDGKDKWAGRKFSKLIVGGHPELSMSPKETRRALTAILKFGIENAGILYGQKIGQCYNCNRSLTKKASRVLSLGRHCAELKGHGEDWDAINATAGDNDDAEND
jgi:hypothetical protein